MKLFLILALFSTVLWTVPAYADQCDDIIRDNNALDAKASSQVKSLIKRAEELSAAHKDDEADWTHCEISKLESNRITAAMQRFKKTDTVCGKRLVVECDLECLKSELTQEEKWQAVVCVGVKPNFKPSNSGPSENPDQVGNAAGCIEVVKEGATLYHFNNTCSFAVSFVFTSRDENRNLEADDTNISAQSRNSGNSVISYFSYKPTIIWACVMKTPGCSDAAADAQKNRFNAAQGK